jgi:GT2 family glycosyltransferase
LKITVGIKALNEEGHIAASLGSAVEAVRPFAGEVILADSGSTDRTIEIARQFPVRIYQLAAPSERSCGTGAQLAFQHAEGEYFYLLDGDMVLDPAFLPAGIAFLETSSDFAAVGGRMREVNTDTEEYQIRANIAQADSNWRPGTVDRLDCGGLYRTSALKELGYFADRNLHAFEEFELGARLREKGWKLARIDVAAVEHYGHTTGSFRLLWRRLKSGYAAAHGEVLRGAIGRPHLPLVVRNLSHIRNSIAVIVWWAALLVLAFFYPLIALTLLVLPLLLLVVRRKSLRLGLYSFTMWNTYAWGLIAGLFRPRVPPERKIASVELAGAVPDKVSASR